MENHNHIGVLRIENQKPITFGSRQYRASSTLRMVLILGSKLAKLGSRDAIKCLRESFSYAKLKPKVLKAKCIKFHRLR